MATEAKPGCWIGFDLGGTKMLATVYDSNFEPLGRKRRRTKGMEGAESVAARIIRTLEDAMEEAKIEPAQVRGIGVGVPGPVDPSRGLVLEAVNLNWKSLPLAEIIREAIDRPIVLLNDVDSGVYGEYRFGAGISARTVLGIFPGTGIGGGCVYDGQIICGQRSTCMEIGHIPVREAGNLCGCGLRGCLEVEASRLAISAEVAKAAYRGEAPTILAEAGTDLSQIRSALLAKAIKAGDVVVEQIIRRAAVYLGRAVATAVHLMAPDTIVLGGGMVEAMPKLYVSAVSEAANAVVMPSFVDSFKIVVAELGDDAAVLGAAGWAERTFGESEAN